MSVAEVVVAGVFRLLSTALSFAFMLWIFANMGRLLDRFTTWGGRHDETYGVLDPRRFWCRHRVSKYGPGRFGLWAIWCTYCGKKVDAR